MFSVLLGLFSIPSGKHYLVLANFVLLGMVIVPIIPVSMNFGSELTFPISPIMTNGILLMVGQGMGGILGILETILIGKSVIISLISYVLLAGIALGCTIFIKEDLRKTKFAESAHKSQN